MIKSAAEFVQLCENRLGWTVDFESKTPHYTQRAIMISRVKKAMIKDPSITYEGLELTVEYSWKKRMPITSPLMIFPRVKEALEWANLAKPKTDLETRRLNAIHSEIGSGLPQSSMWVRRLQRSYGDGVEDVLEEWEEARRVEAELSSDAG